jgi:hypothetical protein
MSTESGSRRYGRFDLLAEEFAGRYRPGELPGLQAYIDRLPESMTRRVDHITWQVVWYLSG